MKSAIYKIITATSILAFSAASFAHADSSDWSFSKKDSAVSSDESNSGSMFIVGGIGYNLNRAKVSKDTTVKNISPSNGASFLIGVGYNVSEDLRVDATFNYDPSQKTKNTEVQNFKSMRLMFNGYYDFVEVYNDIKAYGNVGLGLTRLTVDGIKNNSNVVDPNFSKSKNAISWQLGAGVNGKITQNLMWDVGYRYINNTKASWDAVSGSYDKGYFKLHSHNLIASARYNF